MKVLITGAKGLLATNIIPLMSPRFDLATYDLDEWDITDAAAGRSMMDLHRPDVVLNLAAMTDVDGCEDRPELARKVNAEGAGVIAGLCADAGSRLIHISTDYVFDGMKMSPYGEDDEPSPRSVYGRTKLAGEAIVLARLPGAAILRTEWLYGKGQNTFIEKVIAIARSDGRARVVNDQVGSPTYARDLAVPIIAVIEKGLEGIYHVSNRGSCSWFDFARAIFSLRQIDVPVEPISSAELARKAIRPSYSVFDLTKIERTAGIAMRPWLEALGDYMASDS